MDRRCLEKLPSRALRCAIKSYGVDNISHFYISGLVQHCTKKETIVFLSRAGRGLTGTISICFVVAVFL